MDDWEACAAAFWAEMADTMGQVCSMVEGDG